MDEGLLGLLCENLSLLLVVADVGVQAQAEQRHSLRENMVWSDMMEVWSDTMEVWSHRLVEVETQQ